MRFWHDPLDQTDHNWEPHFAMTDEEKLQHCKDHHLKGRDLLEEELRDAEESLERAESRAEDAEQDAREYRRAGEELTKKSAEAMVIMSQLRTQLSFEERDVSILRTFEKLEAMVTEMHQKLGRQF